MEATIEKLKKRLQQPLPGQAAHQRMSSVRRAQEGQAAPKNVRRSAVLILLIEGSDQPFIPLIKRPEYEGVHSGQMALPGGKIEEQDPSIIHTALRETEEEIGIKVSEHQVIGQLSELYIPPSRSLVTPVIAHALPSPYQLDPNEVARLVEVPLSDFFDPKNLMQKEITVMQSVRIKAPTFQLAGETVWGATAMIMSEFLMVYQEAQ